MRSHSVTLMLVSARADGLLREGVRAGVRPEPEYLLLERQYGVELFDWSAISDRANHRSPQLAISHALNALRRRDDFDHILSDGEHVGVPVGLGLRSRRAAVRHTMIGHHLTTAKKRLLLAATRAGLRDSHFIVHCREQLRFASDSLGVPADHTHLVPYGVDLAFWRPLDIDDQGYVMAAGRDHRDYVTFAAACEGAVDAVFVAGSSLHSASATCRTPTRWPNGFSAGFVDYPTLRERYAGCSMFVLPLLPTDFQAGVTALLEAMAMGKAVIATANPSVAEVVLDGETGVLVPPDDPLAMREAITALMDDPRERRRLGRNAREAVELRHGLYDYAARLYAVTEGAVATPVC